MSLSVSVSTVATASAQQIKLEADNVRSLCDSYTAAYHLPVQPDTCRCLISRSFSALCLLLLLPLSLTHTQRTTTRPHKHTSHTRPAHAESAADHFSQFGM